MPQNTHCRADDGVPIPVPRRRGAGRHTDDAAESGGCSVPVDVIVPLTVPSPDPCRSPNGIEAVLSGCGEAARGRLQRGWPPVRAVVTVTFRLRSSLNSDLSGDTFTRLGMPVEDADWKCTCPSVVVLRLTGSGPGSAAVTGSCLMGISEIDGATVTLSASFPLWLLDGALELESAECGDPGHGQSPLRC